MYIGTENEWGNLLRRPFIQVPENGNGELSNPVSNMYLEHVMKFLFKPQHVNNPGAFSSHMPQESSAKTDSFQGVKNTLAMDNNQKDRLACSPKNLNHSQSFPDQCNALNLHPLLNSDQTGKLHPLTKLDDAQSSGATSSKTKLESVALTDHDVDLPSIEGCNMEKASQMTFPNQNQSPSWPIQPQLESQISHSQLLDATHSDYTILNGLLPQADVDEWMLYSSSCQPFTGISRSTGPLSAFHEQSALLPQAANPPLPSMSQEMWDHYLKNLKLLPQADQLITPISQQGLHSFNCMPSSNNLRDLSTESNNQSGVYSNVNVDVSNSVSTMVDPSTSSTILDEFCTLKDGDFQNPSDCMVGNLSSSQDVQSQITSASLADSHVFPMQDITDNSGGTCSSHIDFDDSSFLQNNSWQQVTAPMRTYTKVCSSTRKLF